jgi:hypothetical protein
MNGGVQLITNTRVLNHWGLVDSPATVQNRKVEGVRRDTNHHLIEPLAATDINKVILIANTQSIQLPGLRPPKLLYLDLSSYDTLYSNPCYPLWKCLIKFWQLKMPTCHSHLYHNHMIFHNPHERYKQGALRLGAITTTTTITFSIKISAAKNSYLTHNITK